MPNSILGQKIQILRFFTQKRLFLVDAIPPTVFQLPKTSKKISPQVSLSLIPEISQQTGHGHFSECSPATNSGSIFKCKPILECIIAGDSKMGLFSQIETELNAGELSQK